MGNGNNKFGDSLNSGNTSGKYVFGSIKDKENPRAGYYYNAKKNVLIYNTETIKLLNSETSVIKLKYSYAKTNMRVFYKGKQIIGADPSTFKTINRREIKNLNNSSLNSLNSVIGMDIKNGITRYYHKGVLLTE